MTTTAQSNPPIVVAEHLGKTYRRGQERANPRFAIPGRAGRALKGDLHTALDDVSFALSKGDSLGIVGDNGAGKSTLLKLVVGVTSPTSGRIRVKGRVAALIELGTGFHPDLTGRENIVFNAAILGMGRRELAGRMDAIIDFAAIDSYLDTPVKRYSSGMMARLGFAVASHLDADLLVLDEVLSVGDAAFQRKCHERVRELRRTGVALVYVTHALATVPILCKRAMLLERGRVVIEGEPRAVLHDYQSRHRPVHDDGGTGRARLTNASVQPGTMRPGDDLVVTVDLDLAEPLVDGYLMLSIHDPDMAVVAGTKSSAAGLLQVAGRWRLSCQLSQLWLSGGDYLIYLTVMPGPDLPVAEGQVVTPLKVTSDGSDEVEDFGRMALQPAWSAGPS